MADLSLQADSACATSVPRLCAANDDSPSREFLRLKIMLDWWEGELREILADRPARRSFAYRAWRLRLDEAQERVCSLRDRLGRAA